jgi:hypothetical protein
MCRCARGFDADDHRHARSTARREPGTSIDARSRRRSLGLAAAAASGRETARDSPRRRLDERSQLPPQLRLAWRSAAAPRVPPPLGVVLAIRFSRAHAGRRGRSRVMAARARPRRVRSDPRRRRCSRSRTSIASSSRETPSGCATSSASSCPMQRLSEASSTNGVSTPRPLRPAFEFR